MSIQIMRMFLLQNTIMISFVYNIFLANTIFEMTNISPLFQWRKTSKKLTKPRAIKMGEKGENYGQSDWNEKIAATNSCETCH